MDKLKELKALHADLKANATTPEEVERANKLEKEIQNIEASNKEWASKYAQAIRHTSGGEDPNKGNDDKANEYEGAPLEDIGEFADWYLDKHPVKKQSA